MKLAHYCSSNLQAYGAGLIEQASELLNKLLDDARQTTKDAIMITSFLDLVDAVNSGAGHVPLPPRKPDDADGGGDSWYGAGDKLLPEVPSGYGAISLGGNQSSVNGTDVI